MTAPPGGLERSRRRHAWVLVVGGVALAAALVQGCVLGLCVVDGDSMAPTLVAGERLLVLKLHGQVERGDLLVFRDPWAPEALLVKRVVGLPGEELSAAGGRLRVGAFDLAEEYLAPGTPLVGLTSPTRVPAGCYFLLGDNRAASVDSRRFGPVEDRLVVGKVLGRLGPRP